MNNEAYINKCHGMAKQSIGHRITIRLNPREFGGGAVTCQAGIITECEFIGVKARRSSVIAKFRVMLECGENKVTRGPFTVTKIPQ